MFRRMSFSFARDDPPLERARGGPGKFLVCANTERVDFKRDSGEGRGRGGKRTSSGGDGVSLKGTHPWARRWPSSPRPSSPSLPPFPTGEEGGVRRVSRKTELAAVLASLSRRLGGRLGERGWGVRVSPEGAALFGPQSDKVG